MDRADDSTTVAREKHHPALAPAATYRLVVTAGPEQGTSVTLDGSEPSPLLIGQSAACTLRVSDPMISRRHMSLEVVDRLLHIVDLGSTNGTSVNGLRVNDACLAGGEIVRLGETTLLVELVDSATAIAMPTAGGFGRLIGTSREMRRLYPLCDRLAKSSVPLILEGETGTGKELLAESIHEMGPRAAGPFVVFDCTATPPNLLESDLFGHERGAFTGAIGARSGVFEQAHGGTLLIDEIGDLALALQPKLLRVLERSEVRRLGGNQPLRVDVRVLAATRRNLDREVQAGRFRDDLFHRLAVARIELPPLRRRRGDVPLLADAFCRQLGSEGRCLPADLIASWEDYAWPGNVRELRNAVARHLALGDLPADTARNDDSESSEPAARGLLEQIVNSGVPFSIARQRVLRAFERMFVEKVLAEHGGNVLRAAEASGIARRQLQRVRARLKRA